MHSWVKSAAVWIKEREVTARIDAERFVEERRLIRSQGETRWQEIREGLEARCQELEIEAGKKVLGFEVCPKTQVVIRNLLSGFLMKVQLDLDAAQIEWSCGNLKGIFVVKPESSWGVALFNSSGVKFTDQEIIERLLGTLLGLPLSGFTPPPLFDKL